MRIIFGADMECIDARHDMTLGISYVPWQRWDDIYEPCRALSRGTIFAQLDKPFKGGCR